MQYATLASGSGGNAAVVWGPQGALLIDAGLGPRVLAARLAHLGLAWTDLRAVLLTHTHSDHWKEPTLKELARHRIPLFHHAEHQRTLSSYSAALLVLRTAGLLRCYESGQLFAPLPGVSVSAFAVSHDSGPTFGFRIEGGTSLFGPTWTLGHVADLGCWTPEIVHALAGVTVLALEFNHDVVMQQTSGRPHFLIARVLSDRGHLSNVQAAELLRAILRGSSQTLQHVVQLHMSQQCNRPELAIREAQRAFAACASSARVHTAWQDRVSAIIKLEKPLPTARAIRARRAGFAGSLRRSGPSEPSENEGLIG